MEHEFDCPFITIECGDKLDEQAHEIAFSGISQISKCPSFGYIHQYKRVEVIYRPLRLQLNNDVKFSLASFDEGNLGITLKKNIEHFNYGSAHQDEMLGWVDGLMG